VSLRRLGTFLRQVVVQLGFQHSLPQCLLQGIQQTVLGKYCLRIVALQQLVNDLVADRHTSPSAFMGPRMTLHTRSLTGPKSFAQIARERRDLARPWRPRTIRRRLQVKLDVLCTVLRSSPTWRAIAETLTPCRCNSRIITTSPSPTNGGPYALKAPSSVQCSRPQCSGSDRLPQAPLSSPGENFNRHIWGVFSRRSQPPGRRIPELCQPAGPRADRLLAISARGLVPGDVQRPEDPRSGNATRYRLLDWLTRAICAAESCVEFADFARDRESLFRSLMSLPASLASYRLRQALGEDLCRGGPRPLDDREWPTPVLDTSFDEDRRTNRKYHGAQNLASLRRLALNILRTARPDISIRRKRKRSGWSDDYRPNDAIALRRGGLGLRSAHPRQHNRLLVHSGVW
jgi:hypothetical protein